MTTRKIASKTEVLEFYTSVLRDEFDEGIKISDRISAADKLHRYLTQEKADRADRAQTGVVLMPQPHHEGGDAA